MVLIFSFLLFLTLQGSTYAMKRAGPVTITNEVSADSNETPNKISIEIFFNEPFLDYWTNKLENKRYRPLCADDTYQFEDLQETAELAGRILPVNKKSYSTLNIPFKKFLSGIRINNEGVLNYQGKFDGDSFIDMFYNRGIPSFIEDEDQEDILFNFDNQLDRVQINTGHDTDGHLLPPLISKRFFLEHIIIADALSQDISNPENLADECNECMGFIDNDGGINNEAQGNIMPYLLSYTKFLQASDNNISNQNVMKTRIWIIQFFKKILHIADKKCVIFTDRFDETARNDTRTFYTLPKEKNDTTVYMIRAEGNNLTLFKK